MAKAKQHSELDVRELQRRIDSARDALAEIGAMFPEAHVLAKADRRRSQGRMGIEEADALLSVVDAIDLMPAVFASLADDDEGHDPSRVETDLIRARFARHRLYATLATEVQALAQRIADQALTLGAQVKPFTLAAYEIAKPISKRDGALRDKVARALDYYGGNAAAGQAARRAREDEPVEA